ncbi:MAG: apolipoprotein N-acyltransferase, partial [Cytophagales bacterium]|nr:apolipoprotein N-acyltransferase [Cytophagales bacterium]
VCYESIYGEFVGEYIKKGAGFIAIITNDGWWGNTPGHKQHLAYACLRAIETRKSVARSANTGISAFINQRGDIVRQTEWWKMDALSENLKANDRITFYVQWGDYIGKICILLTVLVIGYSIYYSIVKK